MPPSQLTTGELEEAISFILRAALYIPEYGLDMRQNAENEAEKHFRKLMKL